MATAAWLGRVTARLLSLMICLGTCLSSEVSFMQVPSCMYFDGNTPMKAGQLRDVLSAMMGYTVQREVDFPVLKIPTPFCSAEGVAVVSVSGLPMGFPSEGVSFPLVEDGSNVDETYPALESRTRKRYHGRNSTFLRMDLADAADAQNLVTGPQLLRDVSATPEGFELNSLDLSRIRDRLFLEEMQMLKELARNVPLSGDLRNGAGDVLWLQSNGLTGLVDSYGPDSPQVKEAKQVIGQVMLALSEVMESAYDGKVVVAMVARGSNAQGRVRKVRAVTDPPTPSGEKSFAEKVNLSKNYPEDYPAMFNIFLWTMIAFFIVLAIVIVGTCTMDPGKDSIIYRVTSQRMKKDN